MSDREYLKDVHIRDLSAADEARCSGLGFDFMLESGYKVIEVEDLYCIVSKSDYENFGRERLCDVVYKEYSDFLEEFFLKVDFAQIANDPEFNKPKEIPVSFVKLLPGSGEALFKSDAGKYYIRQDNSREGCAVWLSAFKHKGEWTDNAYIRPNVTFVMGNERETVTHSNWAGPGVWVGYNAAFANVGLEQCSKSVDSIVADAVGRCEGANNSGHAKDAEFAME